MHGVQTQPSNRPKSVRGAVGAVPRPTRPMAGVESSKTSMQGTSTSPHSNGGVSFFTRSEAPLKHHKHKQILSISTHCMAPQPHQTKHIHESMPALRRPTDRKSWLHKLAYARKEQPSSVLPASLGRHGQTEGLAEIHTAPGRRCSLPGHARIGNVLPCPWCAFSFRAVPRRRTLTVTSRPWPFNNLRTSQKQTLRIQHGSKRTQLRSKLPDSRNSRPPLVPSLE